MQDFRRLRAWQKAQAFSVQIHRLVQTFPKKGFARLKAQMKKSSEAIPDNIAEACGAATQPDRARFLSVSIRESTELENHIDRARRFGLMSQASYVAFSEEVQTIRKMTIGLRDAVVSTYAGKPPEAGDPRRRRTEDGAGKRKTDAG